METLSQTMMRGNRAQWHTLLTHQLGDSCRGKILKVKKEGEGMVGRRRLGYVSTWHGKLITCCEVARHSRAFICNFVGRQEAETKQLEVPRPVSLAHRKVNQRHCLKHNRRQAMWCLMVGVL